MTGAADPAQLPKLAVILPTLNERENLAALITRIGEALESVCWEIIVVDDDSPDGTADEARRLAESDPRIRVIQRFGRRGLASAALEGMCAASAPFLAVMDADHQHDPALLPEMLRAVEDASCDLAAASRFAKGAAIDGWNAPDREKLSGLATRFVQRWAGTSLSDPLSGYFLTRTDRIRTLAPSLSGIGFKLLLDLVSAANPPLKVREFPLVFAARNAGESKLDKGVALDFLAAMYDRAFGRILPTRFMLFGTVGAVGVAVHLAILALIYPAVLPTFWMAQATATLAAMSGNFLLNNTLTYRDRRLRGGAAMLRGWIGFCGACAVGAVANVAVASLFEARGVFWLLAGAAGLIVGAVWNYALSSRFVWSRY